MNGAPTAAEIFGPRPDTDTAPRPPRTPPLAAILHDVQVFIRKYVVLTDEQAIAVTLWVAHTHVIDAADCTPYLQITSATKRAGKTRLLEVLEPLVARPWLTGRTSAAALVRKVDALTPTLLLDESDAALGAAADREYSEALRGLLNSGYRRSGRSTVCVGQGANITVRDFSTFSAKAIAGIGELPGTIADRAVRLGLKRRLSNEACARWRERDGHTEAAPMREALVTWGERDYVVGLLRAARPALPATLGDRQADVWEPLLAIAELAGADWAADAERAAKALAGAVDDPDMTVELLKDIQAILTTDTVDPDAIATNTLIARLVELTERPWATWRKDDKPITARGVARLLDPLDIHSDRHSIGGTQLRGYRRDAFDDAIARYLPIYVSMCLDANETGPESPKTMCPDDPPQPHTKSEKTPIDIGEKTHRHIDPGDEGLPADFVPPNGISRDAWIRLHMKGGV